MAEPNTKDSLPIRQFGDPVLREHATEVDRTEIEAPQIQGIIDDMVLSLHAAGGIGLAAPQIGVSRRIIIIEIPAMTRVGYGMVPETPLLVLINPQIVSASSELRRAPEACLSIRSGNDGVYEGIVERPETVQVQGYDRAGNEVTVQGDKLLGRALQHEIDHLDGILFTDRIRDLKDLRIYFPVSTSDPVLGQNSYLANKGEM
jgi:peptide deformylase